MTHSRVTASLVTFAGAFLLLFVAPAIAWRPWPNQKINATELQFGGFKKYEGSSEFVK